MQVNDLPSVRHRPKLAELFQQAGGRHLKDDELDLLLGEVPELALQVEAARTIRSITTGVVKKVVAEVFSQYPYEKAHEYATAKCPRDVNYVVAYASLAMLARDPEWLDTKVLLWLRTILQSFEFPDRVKSAANALFADRVLEDALAKLPVKNRSTFHCYYRIQQEMRKAMPADQFEQIQPYLQLTIDTLTETF
jgi:hypothetical protein